VNNISNPFVSLTKDKINESEQMFLAGRQTNSKDSQWKDVCQIFYMRVFWLFFHYFIKISNVVSRRI